MPDEKAPTRAEIPLSTSTPLKVLDLQDPVKVRTWLTDIRVQLGDILAAGKDTTRRRTKRFFSRAEARRRMLQGEHNLLALIEAAERGLAQSEAAEREPEKA